VASRLRGYHQGALVYGARIAFEELRLQPDRKLILTEQIRNLIGVVLASLALAACSPDAEIQSPGISDDAILIGSSSALTGHASFLGSQYTLGSKVWFNEVNAAGGIHGRRLDFLTYDDAYEPDKTVANSRRLITEDRVFMLFDYVGTPTSVQIIEMVHDEDIPAFGFLTGAETLRTPFRPDVFHVRASYYHEAEGAIAYFVDHLGFEKIAVMYQDDAFGLAVLAGVQLSMRKRDLEIIASDSFTRGSLELDRPVDTISNSGADAVILVGTYSPLAKFIKGVHDAGHRPYFHTVSFVGSRAFGRAILEEGVDRSQFHRIIVTQVVPSPYSEDLETVPTGAALPRRNSQFRLARGLYQRACVDQNSVRNGAESVTRDNEANNRGHVADRRRNRHAADLRPVRSQRTGRHFLFPIGRRRPFHRFRSAVRGTIGARCCKITPRRSILRLAGLPRAAGQSTPWQPACSLRWGLLRGGRITAWWTRLERKSAGS
jgi:ABC-type branched-subunit amino acid transport system substrate-binding protein